MLVQISHKIRARVTNGRRGYGCTPSWELGVSDEVADPGLILIREATAPGHKHSTLVVTASKSHSVRCGRFLIRCRVPHLLYRHVLLVVTCNPSRLCPVGRVE
jgi:hypothetical protein